MLIDLTKKEIKILSEFIEHWNDVEQEYQDEIDIINQKLRNLDKCCTCQEDGLDYEQDYLTP